MFTRVRWRSLAAIIATAGVGIAISLTGILDGAYLLLGVIVLIPLERIFRRHNQPVVRTGYRADLIHACVTEVLSGLALLVPAVPIIVLLTVLPIPTFAPAFGLLPLWLKIVVSVLVVDVGIYFSHRLQHEVPLFWRFHQIHHSSQNLDWLAAVRNHPFDVLPIALIVVPSLFMLGLEEPVLGPLVAVQAIQGIALHLNVRWRLRWLDRWLVTPEFHHWHHELRVEAHDANYSVFFPWWDRIFGTLYVAHGQRPERYGIAADVPDTFWGQMKYPLRRRSVRDNELASQESVLATD